MANAMIFDGYESREATDAEQAQIDADVHAQAEAAAAAQAAGLKLAWAGVRARRNLWLSQAQVAVLDVIDGVGAARDLPQPIVDDANANAAAWKAWAQALRDLPASLTDETVAAAIEALGPLGTPWDNSTDEFPAPWPQPPKAPRVILT